MNLEASCSTAPCEKNPGSDESLEDDVVASLDFESLLRDLVETHGLCKKDVCSMSRRSHTKMDLVTGAFNQLIKRFAKTPRWQCALSLLGAMKEYGVWPDGYTHSIAANASRHGRSLADARHVLEDARMHKKLNLTYVYNVVLALCVDLRNKEEGKRVHAEMLRDQVERDHISIYYLRRVHDSLEQMRRFDWALDLCVRAPEPDIHVYEETATDSGQHDRTCPNYTARNSLEQGQQVEGLQNFANDQPVLGHRYAYYHAVCDDASFGRSRQHVKALREAQRSPLSQQTLRIHYENTIKSLFCDNNWREACEVYKDMVVKRRIRPGGLLGGKNVHFFIKALARLQPDRLLWFMTTSVKGGVLCLDTRHFMAAIGAFHRKGESCGQAWEIFQLGMRHLGDRDASTSALLHLSMMQVCVCCFERQVALALLASFPDGFLENEEKETERHNCALKLVRKLPSEAPGKAEIEATVLKRMEDRSIEEERYPWGPWAEAEANYRAAQEEGAVALLKSFEEACSEYMLAPSRGEA